MNLAKILLLKSKKYQIQVLIALFQVKKIMSSTKMVIFIKKKSNFMKI